MRLISFYDPVANLALVDLSYDIHTIHYNMLS